MKVIGYTRVSTEDQARHGAGIEAQKVAIHDEVSRRGWELVEIFTDSASGRSMKGRPGLEQALEAIESGEASVLLVAKLDRLSRSLMDFAGTMERARRRGWSIVALDLNVDTTTPSGELMANVLGSFAQYERRLIGQRTREGLAVKRSQGVRLGRPPVLGADVRKQIRRMRSKGLSLQKIAEQLNVSKIPTAQGGKQWYPSTVSKVLRAAA